MRKIKRHGRLYKQRLAEVLISNAPEVRPCKNCGSPVIEGYCCAYCGTDKPDNQDEEPENA